MSTKYPPLNLGEPTIQGYVCYGTRPCDTAEERKKASEDLARALLLGRFIRSAPPPCGRLCNRCPEGKGKEMEWVNGKFIRRSE